MPTTKTKLTDKLTLYLGQHEGKSIAPNIPWDGKVTVGDWVGWIEEFSEGERRILSWSVFGFGHNAQASSQTTARLWAADYLKAAGISRIEPPWS